MHDRQFDLYYSESILSIGQVLVRIYVVSGSVADSKVKREEVSRHQRSNVVLSGPQASIVVTPES